MSVKTNLPETTPSNSATYLSEREFKNARSGIDLDLESGE
jgi:hypothetical protein